MKYAGCARWDISMTDSVNSPLLKSLGNRINLLEVPFTERASRLLVFLKDGHFAVRLAERWVKRDPDLVAYRDRPPLLDRWNFTDGDGTPLAMEVTTYPHCICCQTALGSFRLTYADPETLLIALPAAQCGMTFRARVDQAQPDRRGGVLRLTGEIRRSIAYTTNAPILRSEITTNGPQEQIVHLRVDASQGGKAALLNITPRLGFNRWVPDAEATLEAAARRWHEWLAATPEVAESYRAQYIYAWWIMRAGLISSRYYTTREVMTPSKFYYIGAWQWDNFFHALAYRHIDSRLAEDQIRILLDHQRSDGMIPDAVHDEGVVTHLSYPIEADVTKPPLIAWAAWKLYEQNGDREFLDEIYEPLVRWNNWWFENNDVDGNGLCEYQHPYSSGLDDSPLWDDGMPVESPELNSYLCLQQEALAKIAGVIGEHRDAKMWALRATSMVKRLIRHKWDASAGLFWATRNGARINVRTPFNLFPLITGRMPPEIAARLVGHLTDEREFWPRYPVPTVALDDPTFDPQQMWRGPTWANINYLLIEGLFRSGYTEVARELRRRTLALIAGQPDICEYYDPCTGHKPPQAAPAFGWSAALYIDLAIQATHDSEGQQP